MAGGFLPPVVAVLLADSKQFSAAMGEAKAEMTSVSESGKASLLGLSNMAKVGFAAVGVAIGTSITMAAQFQTSMERLHTQAGVSQGDLAALSNGVLNLAGQVGFSPNSLAQALFHIESSFASTGISGGQALDILKIAAEGAKIGGADLVDVTNALDAAIASGIPGVQNYAQAMGALNAIVGSGDMTMQNLAEALGTGVLAVVKNYGLSLTDVGAALATFGDNNIRGAQAATYLRMAVQAMAVPMASGKAVLEGIGLTTQSMAHDMQEGGLIQAVQDLHDHLDAAGISGDKVGEALTAIFGKRAGSGVAVLYDQLDRLKSKVDTINSSANSFQADWAAALHTFSVQMGNLGGAVESAAIRFGTMLLPAATKVVGVLSDVVDFVTHSHEALTVLAGVVAAVAVPAILRFAVALGTTALTAMFNGLAALTQMGVQMGLFGAEAQAAAVEADGAGIAMEGMLGPIGLIAGGLTALTVALHGTSGASKQASDYISAFITDAQKSADPVALMTVKIKDLQASLDQMRKPTGATIRDWLVNQVTGDYKQYDDTVAQIKQVQDALDKLKAAQQAQNDVGTSGLDNTKKAAAAAAKSIADAKAALTALTDAMDQMTGGAVTAEKDLIAFNQGLDDMTAKLKANKDSLDINTQAGRDDQSAIITVVEALTQQAQAMAKGGASSDQLSKALTDGVTRLRNTAIQAGLTTAQISALIDQYNLTPADIQTYVNLYGVDAASAQIDSLQNKLAGLMSLGGSLPKLFGGVSSLVGQVAHNAPPTTAALSTSSTIRAFALGGFVPDTGLAFLHAGEYVLPPEMVQGGQPSPLATAGIGAPGGGGAGSVVVNVNLTVQGSVMTETDLVRTIQTGLLRLKRVTGPLGLS